jgi:hypothetical protein
MPDDIEKISKRINELGKKSSQILLFLSFAMLSVVTLETGKDPPPAALNCALWWWKCALIPILVGILPMKEFIWNSPSWYRFIWVTRVILLWLAVLLIVIGVWLFFKVMTGAPQLTRFATMARLDSSAVLPPR